MKFFLTLLIMLPAMALADDLQSVIDARNKAWTDAYNAGDIDAVLEIFTDDFVAMPGGAPTITDREELHALLTAYLPFATDMKFETDSLDVMGDYAYELGRSSFMLKNEDGSHSPGSEKYLVVWRRGEDGVWYYHADIWWTPNE